MCARVCVCMCVCVCVCVCVCAWRCDRCMLRRSFMQKQLHHQMLFKGNTGFPMPGVLFDSAQSAEITVQESHPTAARA